MRDTSPQRTRRIRMAALVGVLAAASLSLTATPASAEDNPMRDSNYDQWWDLEPDGSTFSRCADHTDKFRFRFYYNSDYAGSWINIGHPLWDLLNVYRGDGPHALTFCDGKGNGAGQVVGNNAASVYNWYDGFCGTVYYNSGYNRKGPYRTYSPRSGGNLADAGLKNENRSIEFATCW
ncbi:hypothetical protein [Streptomyces tanashiensis]|uniref:Secreted protein n=1 Tax=Streptomyces tanashiensis TaxID=67367 RepID=A0ABY6QPY7_9ACTN|nr:hypothetical protein [Streptomyces tanashiensis]UZX19868.1 hypothetical protein LDH80_03630 [Streptomyces tanashiensis]GGY42251.1 hypothetical protein GCM10010299_55680 [Streptomyces tanashiensis]